MEQVIWIEVVSRHNQVLSRFRFEKNAIRIGRGYDNDIIIDDPFIAPDHLLIEVNPEGNLSARDLDTLNGLYIAKSKGRKNLINLDDNKLIRLGQTFLRVRTNASIVSPERKLLPQVTQWYELALLLVLPTLFSCLLSWMESTKPFKLSGLLMSIAGMSIFMLAWGGIWAIFSRIFSGVADFGRHIRVSCLLLIGVLLLYMIGTVGSYAFSTTLISKYVYVPILAVIGYFIFESLCVVGRFKIIWKATIVGGLVALIIAVSSIAKFSEPKIITDDDFDYTLAPPSLRLVQAQSKKEFLAKAAQLKDELNMARQEEPPADYVPKN